MKTVLAAALAVLSNHLSGPAPQPETAKPVAQVTFQFDRPGVQVPKFTLTVNEDGTSRYDAEQVVSNAGALEAGATPATQHIDRTITLSRTTTRQIFAAARGLNRFNHPCASKLRNIADTGKKTLHYVGEGGEGTCVYNYSQDKRVLSLTETFMAIAATLDIGRKLDFDHRFDRLGLDSDTARLVQEVNAGRAIELGTIGPTLLSIAQDSDVLERVRSQAANLLRLAQRAF